MISLGVVLAVVSMLRRLRGSYREERQQLRLIALAAGLAAAGLVVLFVGQAINGGDQTWGSSLPLVRRLLPDADPVRGRGAPLPALRPRRDHQPHPAGGRRDGFRRSRLHHPGRGRGTGRRGPNQRFLALAARDDGGRTRLPTTAPGHGPAGRPGGVRQPGASLRGARGLQPPAGGGARPGRPAPGGRRGGGSGGVRERSARPRWTSPAARPSPGRGAGGPPGRRTPRRSRSSPC